jgi:cell division protease FtsH
MAAHRPAPSGSGPAGGIGSALQAMKQRKWLGTVALIAAFAAVWLASDLRSARTIESVPYSVFEKYLREGQLVEVQVGDTLVSGRFGSPHDGKTGVVAELVEPALAERLAPYGVPYARVHESKGLGDLLSWLAGPLLVLALWYALGRRMAGQGGAGLLGIGRSHAKVYMEQSTGVRFADVAGVDESKAELQEIVDFLRDPQSHGRLGARMPKGILLMGPTGTGKTLLARAVAGEAGVPFFSISGSEFIEMFVGVGAARVRDLFEQARAAAPAIIFIDEIDALGKTRGAGAVFGGHDEREQTLNQLLVELDGFDPSVGVILLAATNRPEILDPALLRAGRFDRQVLVDRPDRAGRRAILAVHAKKIALAADVDLDQVAGITVGFAGADLANVVNEAALAATRRQGSAVTLDDFTAAIERIVAGIEKKSRILGAEERRLVAYHELGHALTALALRSADRVHKVSIVPHGIGALGYTLQRPSEDRHLMRRSELVDKMTVLLGGRAAERLVFGEPSTGAADDLARATDVARDMVLRYGMDEGLGPVSYADGAQGLLPGEVAPARAGRPGAESERRIDAAVQALLRDAQDRAMALLDANRHVLDRCAAELMAHEMLDEAALQSLTTDLRAGAEPAKPAPIRKAA